MDDKLRRLQMTQLDILKMFDQFCQNNNLHYSLYAGTLLGAVRHKGFIPWDDDLDVCMPRQEYDRFITLWQNEPKEGYVLQNKENTPNFTQSFTKLRKDHTTFLQNKNEIGAYHTGIFIDIFPIDRFPSRKIEQYIFKWNCMKYQLFTRGFAPPKSYWFVRSMCSFILMCAPKSSIPKERQKLLKKITRYNSDENLETIAIEVLSTINCPLPANMFSNYTRLLFEDGDFMCFSEWDKYLHRKYGNYMQLPPIEEQILKHHPVLIDFDHNYEELV